MVKYTHFYAVFTVPGEVTDRKGIADKKGIFVLS